MQQHHRRARMFPTEDGEPVLAATQGRTAGPFQDGRIGWIELASWRRAEHQQGQPGGERTADALEEAEEPAQPPLRIRRHTGYDTSQHGLAAFHDHRRKSMKVGYKLQPPARDA